MEIQVIKPRKNKRRKLRTCAYCRVSSKHDDQEGSIINQKEYYESYITENPEYEFVGTYCDIGISGKKEMRP